MGRTAAAIEARERAHLLIRLAAIALGGTLVLLAGVGATPLAALILARYTLSLPEDFTLTIRQMPTISPREGLPTIIHARSSQRLDGLPAAA